MPAALLLAVGQWLCSFWSFLLDCWSWVVAWRSWTSCNKTALTNCFFYVIPLDETKTWFWAKNWGTLKMLQWSWMLLSFMGEGKHLGQKRVGLPLKPRENGNMERWIIFLLSVGLSPRFMMFWKCTVHFIVQTQSNGVTSTLGNDSGPPSLSKESLLFLALEFLVMPLFGVSIW